MTNGLLRSWERRSHCQNNFGNADPWVQRVAKDVSVRSWSDNNEHNPALLGHFLIAAPSINVETSATYFLYANSECMWQFFQKSGNPSPVTKVNKRQNDEAGPSTARIEKCVSLYRTLERIFIFTFANFNKKNTMLEVNFHKRTVQTRHYLRSPPAVTWPNNDSGDNDLAVTS